MIERDLENLKGAPVPAARPHAKGAALEAAMSAFSLGASDSADAEPAGCADDNSTQGNITPLRQTETSTHKRSFRMYLSSRATQAMAASVAALVIAAPFAFQHLERLRDAPLATHVQKDAGIARTELNTPASEKEKKSDSSLADAAVTPQVEPVPSASGKQSGASGLITAPLKVDREDMALKGADPGRAMTSPSDGLGAVGQSPNTMGLSIGGGKQPTEQFAHSPPPAPPITSHPSANATVAGINAPSQMTESAADIRAQIDGLAKRKLEYLSRDRIAADAAKSNPQAWMGDADRQAQIVQDEHAEVILH